MFCPTLRKQLFWDLCPPKPKKLSRIGRAMMLGAILSSSCRGPVAQEIGVEARDFGRPVASAMKIWNTAIRCDSFVPGNDVLVLSTDGEPCGRTFHAEISAGHSAGTYRCGSENRGYSWETHVEKPGDLRTQVCIAIHELGHVAGLPDSLDPRDAMHVEWCPPDGQLLMPRDAESAIVKAKLCR